MYIMPKHDALPAGEKRQKKKINPEWREENIKHLLKKLEKIQIKVIKKIQKGHLKSSEKSLLLKAAENYEFSVVNSMEIQRNDIKT